MAVNVESDGTTRGVGSTVIGLEYRLRRGERTDPLDPDTVVWEAWGSWSPISVPSNDPDEQVPWEIEYEDLEVGDWQSETRATASNDLTTVVTRRFSVIEGGGAPVIETVRVESAADGSSYLPHLSYWGAPDGEPIYWHQRNSNNPSYTALRFALGAAIPMGATITSAVLQVRSLWNNFDLDGALDYGVLWLEDALNPVAISGTSSVNDFGDRMNETGTESVDWHYGPVAAGAAWTSPNAAALVQELVNTGSTSALMFFVHDVPRNQGLDDVHARNYSQQNADRPTLVIEYTV